MRRHILVVVGYHFDTNMDVKNGCKWNHQQDRESEREGPTSPQVGRLTGCREPLLLSYITIRDNLCQNN